MATVFLSHAHEDKEVVRKLQKALEKRFEVWLDDKLPGGDAVGDRINRELGSADCVVVCWSRLWLDPKRDWLRGEAEAARKRGVAISILLEPVDLPVPFNARHALDLTGWDGQLPNERIDRIVDSILKLVSKALFTKIVLATFGDDKRKIHDFISKVYVGASAQPGVLPWDTNDPDPYVRSIWEVLGEKRAAGPTVLGDILIALKEKAPTEYKQSVAELERSLVLGESDRIQIRRGYLLEMAQRFAIVDNEQGSEALLSLMLSRPVSLPLQVIEPETSKRGALLDFLAPGARYVVVADDMDGRTALLHQTILEQAERTLRADQQDSAEEVRLPVVCSAQWSAVAPDRIRMPSKEAERSYTQREQDRCIADGRAVLVIDNWDQEPARWADLLAEAEKHQENTIVIGAARFPDTLSRFRRLEVLPLSDEGMLEIARAWLGREAESFVASIAGDALGGAARRPYHWTAMCIAQRLQLNEAAIHAATEPTVTAPSALPIVLLDELVERMRTGRQLPGRLRGREFPDSEGLADDALSAVSAGGDLDENWLAVGEATGLFVRRGDPPRIEALHPALFEALVARGLAGVNFQRARTPYLEYENNLPRWISALAHALDLKHVRGPVVGTMKNILKASPALGRGALSLAMSLSRAELLNCLGIHAEPPKSWSGYRPDQWRALETRLQKLSKLTSEPDPEVVARLYRRLLPNAPIFDVALLRICLHDLRASHGDGPLPKAISELLDRKAFFKLAGRDLPPSTGNEAFRIETRKIATQTVLMGGAESDDDAWDNELDMHRVEVSAFKISSCAITNKEYSKLEPSWRQRQIEDWKALPEDWGELPAVFVSWYEARLFAEWVGGRLPSEYEWECAAWGGKDRQKDARPYWFSNQDLYQPADLLWNVESSKGRAHPVKSTPEKEAPTHPFELHNILGNVWEWCEDEAGHPYPKGEAAGPGGPIAHAKGAHRSQKARADMINRVIRGGSWQSADEDCRCSARQFAYPAVHSDVIGFRVAWTPGTAQPKGASSAK